MKKLIVTIAVLLFSATLAFAFGASEDESVEVVGVVESVDAEEEGNAHTLLIASEDGDDEWSVRISENELERFDITEGADIELTAVKSDDDELDVDTIVVDGEETEVDRTELVRDDDEVEVETDQ